MPKRGYDSLSRERGTVWICEFCAKAMNCNKINSSGCAEFSSLSGLDSINQALETVSLNVKNSRSGEE